MLFAGLDIGSRTIALVEWDGEQVTRAEVVDTGTDPLANARRLTQGRVYDRLVAPAMAATSSPSAGWPTR